jgi:hypothetical protein
MTEEAGRRRGRVAGFFGCHSGTLQGGAQDVPSSFDIGPAVAVQPAL